MNVKRGSREERSDLGADKVYGVWSDTVPELISYRYVGCQSVLRDRHHAEGWTTLRSHLRGPGSLLGAPLAIAMLDTAGINIDRYYHLALTQIDVQLFEPALDVERLHTVGTVLREARTQVFTECRFEDAGDPNRILGFGAANWSIINPTPEGFEYADPGPGFEEGSDVPPIAEAYELIPRAEGGFVLPSLSGRVGTEALHHGPMLVGLEQAALAVAASVAPAEALALASWNVRIIKAGRRAPFIMSAELLSRGSHVAGLRGQITDSDGDGIAVSHLSYRVVS